MIAMIANPIFINTFVVFIRLYWFEKRFQHIVREARNLRRTRSRSRVNTQTLDEKDPGKEEQGVNGRSIVVLHDGRSLGPAPGMGGHSKGRPAHDSSLAKALHVWDPQKADSDSSNQELEVLESPNQLRPAFTRDIKFADEVKPTLGPGETSPALQVPQERSAEQHVVFLENQRHPKDDDAWRIPGPREFERGEVPEKLPKEGLRLPRRNSTNSGLSDESNRPKSDHSNDHEDDHHVKRNITIDDSNAVHNLQHKLTSPLSKLTLRGTSSRGRGAMTLERPSPVSRLRSRAGTTSSLRSAPSKDKDPMPYLSYQPTVGRNSAFADLTESQREELGGIEYRSLKTLAIILVCK